MNAFKSIFLFGTLTFASVSASQNVHTTAGFESGAFQDKDGHVDAFFVRTLPNPQLGSEAISTGAGGGSASSNWDLRIVRSENRGQTVKPRRGNFFARNMIHFDKDYTGLNSGLEKPRSTMSLAADHHRFDFDDEGWLGVSIFVPKDFEDELARKGSGGAVELIVANTDSSAYFFNIKVFVPVGESESHWVLQYVIDDKNVKGTDGGRIDYSLGKIQPDKGKWTDFIIRYRSNPFSRDTNPREEGIPKANNKLYKANRGILQVWKSEGPVLVSGDREMNRKFSILNRPVGQVPGSAEGKSLLHLSLRMYKYGWQRQPTSVEGPIWLGFDEFRYGQVKRDGTGYVDVHPSGLGCTDRCPAGSSGPAPALKAPPKAPSILSISD